MTVAVIVFPAETAIASEVPSLSANLQNHKLLLHSAAETEASKPLQLEPPLAEKFSNRLFYTPNVFVGEREKKHEPIPQSVL